MGDFAPPIASSSKLPMDSDDDADVTMDSKQARSSLSSAEARKLKRKEQNRMAQRRHREKQRNELKRRRTVEAGGSAEDDEDIDDHEGSHDEESQERFRRATYPQGFDDSDAHQRQSSHYDMPHSKASSFDYHDSRPVSPLSMPNPPLLSLRSLSPLSSNIQSLPDRSNFDHRSNNSDQQQQQQQQQQQDQSQHFQPTPSFLSAYSDSILSNPGSGAFASPLLMPEPQETSQPFDYAQLFSKTQHHNELRSLLGASIDFNPFSKPSGANQQLGSSVTPLFDGQGSIAPSALSASSQAFLGGHFGSADSGFTSLGGSRDSHGQYSQFNGHNEDNEEGQNAGNNQLQLTRHFAQLHSMQLPWANRLLAPQWDLIKMLRLASQRLGLGFDYIESDLSISFLASDFERAMTVSDGKKSPSSRAIAAIEEGPFSTEDASSGMACLKWQDVPENMRPTRLSGQVTHHPYVDLCFPWQLMRDKVFAAMACNLLQEIDLCADVWPGDDCGPWSDEPPYWVHGDDPFDPEAYEVSDRFASHYPWLLDPSIIRRTNWWRRQQGKALLRPEIVEWSKVYATFFQQQIAHLLHPKRFPPPELPSIIVPGINLDFGKYNKGIDLDDCDVPSSASFPAFSTTNSMNQNGGFKFAAMPRWSSDRNHNSTAPLQPATISHSQLSELFPSSSSGSTRESQYLQQDGKEGVKGNGNTNSNGSGNGNSKSNNPLSKATNVNTKGHRTKSHDVGRGGGDATATVGLVSAHHTSSAQQGQHRPGGGVAAGAAAAGGGGSKAQTQTNTGGQNHGVKRRTTTVD